MTLLVRATLRRDAPLDEVATLRDTYGAHQAVWDLFGDHADRRRDFLYRLDSTAGRFYAVAERAPGATPLWDIETKSYDPRVAKGDTLQFVLRANATRRSGGDGGRSDGRRHDVVMDALRRARAEGRDVARRDVVQEAGLAWLERKGEAGGFAIDRAATRVLAHEVVEFRKSGGTPVRLASLDYEGLLTVDDAERFRETLLRGIGPAKGFGFGMMMVRRA